MGIYKSLFLEEEHDLEVTDADKNTTWLQSKLVNGEYCILRWDDWTQISKLGGKLKVGQTKFKKSKIGMVPTEGYSKRDNYSKASIQWLEWLMESSK